MDHEFHTTVKLDDDIRIESLKTHYIIIIDKNSAWAILFIAFVLML